jgi:8-oxo-dGTP diphosphatase
MRVHVIESIGKFQVAVGAIIEHTTTHKILLLKRSKKKDFSGGIWEYITGRMNQFEEPLDALAREVMEESGLTIKVVKPISTYHLFRGEKVAQNELVGIMFWCRSTSSQVRLSKEHTEFKWVTPTVALKMITKPSMQEDIKAYIRNNS